MELCITVPLSPRTPRWRDRTTEGSKASGCFVMKSRNALNNKQTGHCMPSSQDVLPSASMLAWIGGKKIGCRDLLIALPTLLPSAVCSWMAAHTLPRARSVLVFLPRCERGIGFGNAACRVLLLWASLLLPRERGKVLFKGRNRNVFPSSSYRRWLERDSGKG